MKALSVAAVVAGGVLARLGSRGLGLEERLEFSSGRTALGELQEQMEWPTNNPLHPPHVLLVWMVDHGVVANGFFLGVDLLVTALLFATLQRYYESTFKQTAVGENLVLEKWQALGRPRLESNENGDVTVLETEEEEWSACAELQDKPIAQARNLAVAYWLCPITWATCGAQSFAALPVLLVLLSWYLAQRQWRFASGVVFSLLVVLQGPSVWFMLGWPLFALNAKSVWFALGHLASVCGLIWVLGIPTFDWQVRDLRPNIGLWWYLSTEVFDQYRQYFLLLLHSFPFLVGTVLHVFLRHRQEVHLLYALAVWQTFQPFPELVHVFTSVLFLFAHSEFLITSVSRQTLWPCLLVLVATTTFLQPLMLHLWLENAGGNANYYYFQGLISNGMMGILLAQFYLAVVTRDVVLGRIQRFAGKPKAE
ncbi:hypothetical protein BASA82_000008 [Batrachochytrium salamandrivorans]|nr:hypothetical protein BASA82_000008 [Batrachochytrium salamandrivorans]